MVLRRVSRVANLDVERGRSVNGKRWVGVTAGLVLPLSGCYEVSGPEFCAGTTVEYEEAVCLGFAGAGDFTPYRTIIEGETGRALDLIEPLIAISDLRITIVDDPTQVVPEVGLGGFNPNAYEVLVFADATAPDLAETFERELVPLLAHEIHHAMRRREIGYGFTLLQAAVSEGLADHFSVEVSGGSPSPWATALGDADLADWTEELLRQGNRAYDHPEWFFGAGDVPRWTGYAVGYALVRAYLEQNPSQRASTLVGEPAASFDPGS